MGLTGKHLIESLIDSICELTNANVKVGIWDNKRFQLCKKPFSSFTEKDKEYLYNTEKRSRAHVEMRAFYRGQIESVFQKLFGT